MLKEDYKRKEDKSGEDIKTIQLKSGTCTHCFLKYRFNILFKINFKKRENENI